MLKKFKVWITIEEHSCPDADKEDWNDVTEPECLGQFDTLEEAQEYVLLLDRGPDAF